MGGRVLPGWGRPGSVVRSPFLLDLADVPVPNFMQGASFRSLLNGETPDGWQTSLYYRYWMHGAHHNVCAHYGVRTLRFKLIYYYGDGLGQPGTTDDVREAEWELFDLHEDPCELRSVYDDPGYAPAIAELKGELRRLRELVGDTPYHAEK